MSTHLTVPATEQKPKFFKSPLTSSLTGTNCTPVQTKFLGPPKTKHSRMGSLRFQGLGSSIIHGGSAQQSVSSSISSQRGIKLSQNIPSEQVLSSTFDNQFVEKTKLSIRKPIQKQSANWIFRDAKTLNEYSDMSRRLHQPEQAKDDFFEDSKPPISSQIQHSLSISKLRSQDSKPANRHEELLSSSLQFQLRIDPQAPQDQYVNICNEELSPAPRNFKEARINKFLAEMQIQQVNYEEFLKEERKRPRLKEKKKFLKDIVSPDLTTQTTATAVSSLAKPTLFSLGSKNSSLLERRQKVSALTSINRPALMLPNKAQNSAQERLQIAANAARQDEQGLCDEIGGLTLMSPPRSLGLALKSKAGSALPLILDTNL